MPASRDNLRLKLTAYALVGMLSCILAFASLVQVEVPLGWALTLATVWALVASRLLSNLLTKVIFQPVEEIIEVVRKITGGDLNARVHAERRDEVGLLAASFNNMADYLAEFTNDLSRNVALLTIVEEENRHVAAALSLPELVRAVEQGLFRLQNATGSWLTLYFAQSFDELTKTLIVKDSEGKTTKRLAASPEAFTKADHELRIYPCHYDDFEQLLAHKTWNEIPLLVRESLHFKRDSDISTLDRILRAFSLAVAGAVKTLSALELERQHARVSAEIETARAVQEGLLPKSISLEHMLGQALFRPMHHIGGDWYGCYYDQANRLAYYYIADITGHGFDSALITGVVYGCVHAVNAYFEADQRASLGPKFQLERLAIILNRLIQHAGLGRLMMTFMAIAVDVQSGETHCLNAGHRHGLWHRRRLGQVALLGEHPTPPLGLDGTKAEAFVCSSIQLDPLDLLCLYTDGLVENTTGSGKPLRWRDIKDALLHSDNVSTAAERIKTHTDGFWSTSGGKDDATALICQWTPGPMAFKQVS